MAHNPFNDLTISPNGANFHFFNSGFQVDFFSFLKIHFLITILISSSSKELHSLFLNVCLKDFIVDFGSMVHAFWCKKRLLFLIDFGVPFGVLTPPPSRLRGDF